MGTKRLLAVSVGALALLTLASAARADYCITDTDNTTYVLVGQGFLTPAKGRCKAWTGFTPQSGENSPTAGTACKSSDGSHLNLTLTTSFPEGAGFVEIDSISLALPAQTGTGFASTPGSGTATTFSVSGAVCKPPPIKVPTVSIAPYITPATEPMGSFSQH
jgi:hypothetical protein